MYEIMPKIILLAALNHSRTIGMNGTIPWHLPNDFKHFKQTTLNRTVVMGRKTFLSLPGQQPLPKRNNIILSKTILEIPGTTCCTNVNAILKHTKDENEIFIIGGEQIYKTFLPIASQMILTIVDNDMVGDTFFPMFEPTVWIRQSYQKAYKDDQHKYDYSIQVFNRKNI